MLYTRFTPQQIEFLKRHYTKLSNAELAEALGIDSPAKVRKLARRHTIKWKAENWVPQWRAPKASRQSGCSQSSTWLY